MPNYTVRSGQNIYDVALTLHGSVEGIFDLLISNKWLNMETQLKSGMVLEYHDEFAVNKDIAIWLKNNQISVKNGEHTYYPTDIESLITQHIISSHPDKYKSLESLSTDEQNQYWETQYTPRMVIHQQGILAGIIITLKADSHLIVDWGDYSSPQIIEGDTEQEIEHCYKGAGSHIITLYGDFKCSKLDLRNLSGIYYPLGTIHADEFLSDLDITDLPKLIITR